MDELLRLLAALQGVPVFDPVYESVVNTPISRGGEIAKAVTEYKHGVSLTDEEAQNLWRTWCPGGKGNAVQLYAELQNTGRMAEFPKATHSVRGARAKLIDRIASGPHHLHQEPDAEYDGPGIEEIFGFTFPVVTAELAS